MSPFGAAATNPTADGSAVFVADTSTYDAFPGAALFSTGDLLMVYREATDHEATPDGRIRKRTSTDDGATWSAATTIVATGALDNRGPDVTILSTGRVIVTYWTWDGTGGADSAVPYLIYSDDDGSTWSSPVEITTSFTLWAAEPNLIELGNGDLLAAMYGRDTSDTLSSIRISRSTDDGVTWAHYADVVDGPSTSREWAEPCLLLLDNDDILCMIRSDTGTDMLHASTSTDDGATWPAPVGKIPATGKPAVAQRASDGLVVCQFRNTAGEDHRVRASNDRGATWASSDGDFTGGATLKSQYGAWVALSSGQLASVYALESSSSDADCRFVKITGGS